MSTTVQAIDATMGSMLLGTIVSAVLLGVTYIQTFYYFLDFRNDMWFIKAMVTCTVVLDTTHMAFITHTMYYYLISNYHNPPSLHLLTWTVVMEALCTGLTGAIVQCFYLLRVWRLSKSFLLTGIILLFILGQAGCGTAWVILAMRIQTYEELLDISPVTITINALSMTADIWIAASLVLLLRKARTGFKKSDTMINQLIVFVVNTGVLTSFCAVASFISLLASPYTLIYASFYFCIGRLYTNSFLAALNARRIIHGSDNGSHMLVSMPPSVLSPMNSQGKNSQNISIRIETTQERITKRDASEMGHEKSMMDDDLEPGMAF